MPKKISEAKARRIEWTAHNEPWLWPVFVMVVFAGAWWSTRGGPPWAVGLLVYTALGCYLMTARSAHHDLACARCWRRTPPESLAAGEVARRRWSLWFAHMAYDRWYVVFLLLGVTFVPWPPVILAGFVALLLFAVCTAVSQNRHKQLAKWCPRCPRHGGGGSGGTYAPPPVPVLSATK
jgi:hypothetical protein